MEGTETTISETLAVAIVRGLGVQKDKSDFCDVTVVVENAEFKCHRVLLAACSGFFSALLSSGMKEDLEKRVVLQEISKSTFSDVLRCIYEGKDILTEENIFKIWHAANMLQILFLLDECEIFLKKNISVDSCFVLYQDSKLLDRKEMTTFSWDFITRKFESASRCDDILMLTASEMKQLVASQALDTSSEDRVFETILKWAAYQPDEETKEAHISPSTETQQADRQDSLDHTDRKLENPDQNCPPSHGQQTETESSSDECNIRLDNTRSRHLPELLEACRICLVSGKCLMETGWMNPMIRANPKALNVIQDAISYQLQTDRRFDYCPASAIHRSSSTLESVVIAVQYYSNSDALVCRKCDDQWYGLGQRKSGWNYSYSVACFGHSVYVVRGHQLIDEYNMSTGCWRDIPYQSETGGIPRLLSLGNFLYAVHDDSNHSIERLYMADAVEGLPQGKWIKVGNLSTTEFSISSTTTVGDRIIFFGSKNGTNGTVVEWFDTSTLTSSRLNDIPGPSTGMVAFRKGSEAFLLQTNGTLWRICSLPNRPFLEVKYETLLWDFERTLKGAVLFDDELLLFGPSFSFKDDDKQWELSLPGVFKRVKNIIREGDYRCFFHAVIPKKHLTKKVTVS